MLLGLVPCFILIFPNLNFCPLYRAWNTHCSVLRVDSVCSLALPSQPRCHSHHRPCHSHHWGTLMQQASPSYHFLHVICHSGWCLNFCLAFDFITVCVLFFSVWHSICVRIRSWSLVLSWLCFLFWLCFDYVFIVGLKFFIFFVPLLVPQDGVLVAVVVVLYISKMVSWLTAMMMGLACL